MANESIESANDSNTTKQIVKNLDKDLTCKVTMSFGILRNLGNYENRNFSLGYEQYCKPEDRDALTEMLEQELIKWIAKKSAQVDDYLIRRDYGQSQNEGPSYQQDSR
jgi:hypothetical protein